MNGRVYRGTSLERAEDAEFNGYVQGAEYDIIEGFMEGEDVEKDYSGEWVRDIPIIEKKKKKQGVTGGFSRRLGPAQSFSRGAVPLVFFLDGNQIPDLVDVGYDYRFYDTFVGALPWVDGRRTGELRINGSLMGLLAGSDEGQAVTYWGDGLKSRSRDYSDEMEYVKFDTQVDITGAVQGVVMYTFRPHANLDALNGYSRLDTRGTPEGDKIIGEWSDERVVETLYNELRERAPNQHDVYVVYAERFLVNDSWGYDERDINMVYGSEGEVAPENATVGVLGD